MGAIVLFDVTMRLIPSRCCLALAVCGATFQLISAGARGLLMGCLCAAAILGACAVAAAIVRHRDGPGAVALGGGDLRCMVALSLASGASAPVGFAACFVSAAAWSLVQHARGRLLAQEAFAFAPFMTVWLAVGLAGVCLSV